MQVKQQIVNETLLILTLPDDTRIVVDWINGPPYLSASVIDLGSLKGQEVRLTWDGNAGRDVKDKLMLWDDLWVVGIWSFSTDDVRFVDKDRIVLRRAPA